MKYKYPSTWHAPHSPNALPTTENVLKNLEHFRGRGVVVTEKMDGESCTMYPNGTCHARSLDSAHHESRAMVKKLAGDVGHLIPKGWRVCGENMYAEHSIRYTDLESYFLVFNVWDEDNVCLSWKKTIDFCQHLGLNLVPTLYYGMWNTHPISEVEEEINTNDSEGYVVRYASSFKFKDFASSTYKWVRENHVQTDEHWMTKKVVPNELSLEARKKSRSMHEHGNYNF